MSAGRVVKLRGVLMHSGGFLFDSFFTEDAPIEEHPLIDPREVAGFWRRMGITHFTRVVWTLKGVRVGPSARKMLMPRCGIGRHSFDGVICEGCGRDCDEIDCYACNGEGGFDGYEEDPLWYDLGDIVACSECDGRGGWWRCSNPQCLTGVIIRILPEEKE